MVNVIQKMSRNKSSLGRHYLLTRFNSRFQSTAINEYRQIKKQQLFTHSPGGAHGSHSGHKTRVFSRTCIAGRKGFKQTAASWWRAGRQVAAADIHVREAHGGGAGLQVIVAKGAKVAASRGGTGAGAICVICGICVVGIVSSVEEVRSARLRGGELFQCPFSRLA